MKEESIEYFQEKANSILDSFLESMDSSEYRIKITKEDEHSEYATAFYSGFTFVWTRKGQKLALRMIDRLNKLAFNKFPGEYIDIHSHLYQEP